jgi:hypothetical protein
MIIFFFSLSANWNITNLRPAPPLRPNLLTTSSTSANNSVQQQQQSSPASLASSKKQQPTYEEDALVLRVIEAYCAAYQNTSRNTIHSGKREPKKLPPSIFFDFFLFGDCFACIFKKYFHFSKKKKNNSCLIAIFFK